MGNSNKLAGNVGWRVKCDVWYMNTLKEKVMIRWTASSQQHANYIYSTWNRLLILFYFSSFLSEKWLQNIFIFIFTSNIFISLSMWYVCVQYEITYTIIMTCYMYTVECHTYWLCIYKKAIQWCMRERWRLKATQFSPRQCKHNFVGYSASIRK